MTVGRGQQLLASYGVAPILLAWAGNDAPYVRWVAGSTRTKITDPATVPNSAVGCMGYSLDGLYCAIAGGTDGNGNTNIYVYYLRSGAPVLQQQIAPPSGKTWNNVTNVALSNKGDYLFVGDAGNTPYVTEYNRSGSTWTINASPMYQPTGGRATAFNPADDDMILFGGDSSGTVDFKVFKLSNRTQTTITLTGGSTGQGSTMRKLLFSPNGNYVAMDQNGSMFVYSISGTTWTKLTFPTFSSPTYSNGSSLADTMAWKPDSSQLALGTNNSLNGKALYLVNVSGSTLTADSNNPITANNIRCLAYSADGTRLFVGWQATSTPWIKEFNTSTWAAVTDPTTQPSAANPNAMKNHEL